MAHSALLQPRLCHSHGHPTHQICISRKYSLDTLIFTTYTYIQGLLPAIAVHIVHPYLRGGVAICPTMRGSKHPRVAKLLASYPGLGDVPLIVTDPTPDTLVVDFYVTLTSQIKNQSVLLTYYLGIISASCQADGSISQGWPTVHGFCTVSLCCIFLPLRCVYTCLCLQAGDII